MLRIHERDLIGGQVSKREPSGAYNGFIYKGDLVYRSKIMTIAPRVALAAAVFLSSASLATAANMSKSTTGSASSTSQPADTLSLNASQQKMAWQDISGQAVKETPPASFTAKVGSAVPKDSPLTRFQPAPQKGAGVASVQLRVPRQQQTSYR